MDSRERPQYLEGKTGLLFDPHGRQGDSAWLESGRCPPISSGLQESPGAECQPGDGRASLEAHWLQKHRVWGFGSTGVPAVGASTQLFSSELRGRLVHRPV